MSKRKYVKPVVNMVEIETEDKIGLSPSGNGGTPTFVIIDSTSPSRQQDMTIEKRNMTSFGWSDDL